MHKGSKNKSVMSRFLCCSGLLLLLLGSLCGRAGMAAQSGQGSSEIRVAAAADLNHVLPVLIEHFSASTGHVVRTSYGSSGNLSRQIMQGAPFELFMSADQSYVERLATQGLTADDGSLYAIGQLVLFIPSGSSAPADAGLQALAAAINSGQVRRFAIANPAHAPYGQAARQALQSVGVWAAVQPVLVLGDNAAQTARFTIAGSVDAGLIPRSIAAVPEFAEHGRWLALAEGLYTPLQQRMVLLQDAPPAAIEFYRYLQSPPARQIFRQFGFQSPD